MALALSSKAFSDLVSPALNQLYDNAVMITGTTSYYLGKTPQPDEMQSLYDLADEVKHGE